MMDKDYTQPQEKLFVEMLEENASLGGGSVKVSSYEKFEPVVMTKPEEIAIGNGCRIDSFVKLEGGRGLTLAENIHVASFAHLNIGGGKLVIGAGAAFASGAKVISGGNTPDGVSMSAVAPQEEQVLYSRDVTIGKNAAVLTNAVVISVDIGEGGVVAAGAVAIHRVDAFSIVAGVPAKHIGWRKHPFTTQYEGLHRGAVACDICRDSMDAEQHQ